MAGGILLRDGFRRPEGEATNRLPSEEGLAAPKRTPSTEVADVQVVGESLTGQVLESETYPQTLISQVRPQRVCCWRGSAGRHSRLLLAPVRHCVLDDTRVASMPRPCVRGGQRSLRGAAVGCAAAGDQQARADKLYAPADVRSRIASGQRYY